MGSLGLEFEKGLYLGIDFGTTNTVVSVYDYDLGEVYTLPLEGQMVMPTVVQFEEDLTTEGKLSAIYGMEAKEGASIFPESTVMSIKRMLGKENPVQVKVGDKVYDFKPEAIVAQILSFVKTTATEWLKEEKYITGEFSGCVITVPANSTDKQKQRMRHAAMNAGFIEEHIYLRLEPAAAAVTYANMNEEDKKILVYDFGGGTFDACLLAMASKVGEEPEISILSTYGDNLLGGNDLDKIMMDMIYKAFRNMTNDAIDLFDFARDDGLSRKQKKMAIARLYQNATQAKEKLSASTMTRIVMAPFLQEPSIVNIDLEITREAFYNHPREYQMDDNEELYALMKGQTIQTLVDRTIQCSLKCVEASGLTLKDVDEVFLVGGSSAVPEVKDQITHRLGKVPYQTMISPALSISQGAAHYCHMIMLPSEQGPRVVEQTVHPLGIELSGRRFMEVIRQGMTIPEDGLEVDAPELLYTGTDGLTSLAIVIYEDTEPAVGPKYLKFVNERGMKRLGGTTLNHIPEALKGQEKVKVTFKLSRDNLLTVCAKSLSDDGVATHLSVDQLYEI